MNGLTDFRAFVTSFLGLVAAGVATTSLVLVTVLIGITPPWPPAIVPVTALAQLLALIFVYQHLLTAGRAAIRRRMRLGLILLVVLALLYLAGWSALTFVMPDGQVGIRGLACTSQAMALFAEDCPLLPTDRIASAEYEAERLWSPFGLLGARMILLICWIGAYASLVNVIAAFVVFQRRQKPR